MLLVSFTFLGTDAKVEVIGPLRETSIINNHGYLKSLVGQIPSMLDMHGQKYKDTFEWCKKNSDFCDDTLDRQSNFVFK